MSLVGISIYGRPTLARLLLYLERFTGVISLSIIGSSCVRNLPRDESVFVSRIPVDV